MFMRNASASTSTKFLRSSRKLLEPQASRRQLNGPGFVGTWRRCQPAAPAPLSAACPGSSTISSNGRRPPDASPVKAMRA